MCYHGKQSVTIARRFARPRLESVLAKLWLVLDVKISDCQLWGCTHFLLSAASTETEMSGSSHAPIQLCILKYQDVELFQVFDICFILGHDGFDC